MTVRLRIALTIFLAGLATAVGVIVTVAVAFQRFEHESTYDRANAFLGRVVEMYTDMLGLYERDPESFGALLHNLLLFEPDTQLYLLGADGKVLSGTGSRVLPPDFKVALGPVRVAAEAAIEMRREPYVMGDDPQQMKHATVIAARALTRAAIRADAGTAGYLYLVSRPPKLVGGRFEIFRSSLAAPALATVVALIVIMTALMVWIIGAVTRPLQVLSDDVARAARDGFEGASMSAGTRAAGAGDDDDEFARLSAGFRALLDTLRAQWDALRRLDHFRREGVSNLSHDLRSPLTATTACLETLDARWQAQGERAPDRALLQVALRNTRNAARLVRSLGDLAFLDEPSYPLRTMPLDVGEVLDDIGMRFKARAHQQGIALRCPHDADAPAPRAALDIELFERAVANLIDNALKHTPSGGRIELIARLQADEVRVEVRDSGAGIAQTDLAHLFDRFYQARQSASPAGTEGSRGLGLAIVKRIAELHGGRVEVTSEVGAGTAVCLRLPAVPDSLV